MHNWRAIILFSFCASAISLGQPTNEPAHIIVEAAEEVVLTNGVWIATNGITVRYQEAVLTAQKASVNENTLEIVAQGNVRLQRGLQLLVADSLEYNFLTKKM